MDDRGPRDHAVEVEEARAHTVGQAQRPEIMAHEDSTAAGRARRERTRIKRRPWVIRRDVTTDPSTRQAQDEIAALRTRYEQNAPQGFTDEDAYRFERITGALGAPSFPATREELLDVMRGNGAPDSVIVSLKSIGEGTRFASYDELLLALGIGTAGRIDVPGAPDRDPEGGTPGQRV